MTVNRSSAIAGSGISLLSISTILVLIRLYARVNRKGPKPGIDDLFLGLGWLCATSMTVLALYGTLKDGYATHIEEIPNMRDRIQLLFFSWVMEILFLFGLSSVKISIFLYYHTLARPLKCKRMLWVIRLLIAVTTVFMVIYLLLPFVVCKPLPSMWQRIDPEYTEPHACTDYTIAAIAAGVFNTVTDLAAVVVPLILVSKLERPFRQKAGLYALLFVGSVIFAAGCMRTLTVKRLLDNGRGDFTWTAALALLAAVWEIHLALICSCTPYIYYFWKIVRPKVSFASRRIRFMHGKNIHATKRLDGAGSSDWSIRNRTPSPVKPLLPTAKPLLKSVRGSYRGRKPSAEDRAAIREIFESGQKSTSNLNLHKPLPALKSTSESDCEITVAYTPSVRRSRAAIVEEIHSPTIPLESRYRLSTISWRTGSAKSVQSRWSGVRTHKIESLASRRATQKSTESSTGPTTRTAAWPPRSPGLSTIDLDSMIPEDIPEMPPTPQFSERAPSMNNVQVACQPCGRYHPYGYRHTEAEVQANIQRGFSFQKVLSPRPSHSTFFDDDDADESHRPVVRGLQYTV